MTADAAPRLHERIAVIDLGPALGPDPGPGLGPDPRAGAGSEVQQQLAAALAAAGLDPVSGDGVEDALAGRDVERDGAQLAAAMARAARAFGALACGDATAAANQAIGIAAARQAAGRAVPELPRAWSYVLLCADRDNQLDAALAAATQLRALGGSSDVPAAVWAKYPAIDVIANRDLIELDIDAGVAGAAIWIDFQRAGVSPAHVVVAAGEHVIAAAAGSKRGWAAGTAVASQRQVAVPLVEQAGPWAELAQRVAGWKALPAPAELAWVLGRVHARIAVIRRGDQLAAWGQLGRADPPHALGGDAGVAPLGDAARVIGLVADRVRSWNDHAPDPDQPLLVEARDAVRKRDEETAKPTKWWVYAAIAGAAAIGAGVLYLHDSATDRQRVELTYP